jgi:predicted ATPase/serine phosphatase RsbU (regulator of sigma subunit)/tRNA A-37 threonylcarbamoyl transferase component Bud32
MTLETADYTINERFKESSKTVVYRGTRKSDGQPVAIKTLNEEYPTHQQIARFRYEFSIHQILNNIEGVVKAFGLIDIDNKPALVMESISGGELSSLIDKNSPDFLDNFFNIALQITQTIGDIHQQFIIHKDLNPHNILWDAESKTIKIIDFGIATELSREKQNYNTNLLKGSLPFISPEQTGRMNRSIDYRSDYYSLGATFYYLLSGEHAYDVEDDDPMSWIHCHIAKQPKPLKLANPNIAQALSAIIYKLMAKNAEDRYRSTVGLIHDLQLCESQWKEHSAIDEFVPGLEDMSDRFEIQQKLYGREQEVSALMNAFSDIRIGVGRMFLVSGFSGIGKSALINEVHKPIVSKQGYFIRGKFDQYQRNIPYSALANAFSGLMKHLLTESQDSLKNWQQQLLEILGPNAQVIIDFVPELEQIIGPQPKVPHLGTEENQNRFNQVALQFLLLFTRKEKPLVMFIDDLQWADSASLNLISLFMLSKEHGHFLFLGAYRNNEVDQHHPFIVVVNDLKKAGVNVSDLTLEPLKLDHINILISEALYLEQLKTLPLAKLVLEKTGGNPFFINQFLKNAYETGLLSFVIEDKSWVWDLAQIEQQQSSENVIDLVVSKMDRLPAATQKLLSLGACIGNVFDLQTLAIISEQTLIGVAINLWSAVQTGLLLTESDGHAVLKEMPKHERINEHEYALVQERFLHDKVQQAAYSLIEESQKQQVHLSIARLLLQKIPEHELENHYFDIVEHYNKSIELIDQHDERYQLAELNVKAAEKAKAATAYAPALQYYNQAARCLEAVKNTTHSQLNFAIDKGRIECHFLLSDNESGLQLADALLTRCETVVDKIELNNILILYHGGAGQMDKAIDIALDSLRYFDVKLPRNPNFLQLLLELVRAKINLGRKTTDELMQLSLIKDDAVHAAFSLLKELIAPTYLQGLTNLLPYIILRMFNLNLKHGNGPVSAFTYAGYALLWSKLDDFKEAYRFGVLAMDYNKQVDNPPMEARCYFMTTSFALYWRQSFLESQQPRKIGLQKLIDTGENFWASYIYLFGFWQEVVLSTSLDDIISLTEREINFAQKAKQIEPYYVHILHRNLFKNLAGLTIDEDSLDLEEGEEQQALAYFETNATSTMGKFYHVVCRLVLHYHHQQYQQALEVVSQDFINEDVIRDGTFTRVIYTFFTCLTTLALSSDITKPSSVHQHYNKRKNKLKQWFTLFPENFSCMWNLVLAEQARIENQHSQAINHFDQALTAAKQNQSVFFESLSNELYAKFWLKRGNQKIAAVFMSEASYLYYRWGATGKLEFLRNQYASILNQRNSESPTITTTQTTVPSNDHYLTTVYKESSLDLNTLVKASQTLSGEIVLEKLLQKLMHFLIENAGAEKGIVILNEHDQLVIVTQCILVQGQEQVNQQIIALDNSVTLSQTIVRYVARTKELVVLDDAATNHRFADDSYLQNNQIKSVLCLPLLHKGALTGILYLENNLANNTFTPDRVETLQVLSSEIVVSLENARLYRNLEENNQTLEQKVKERTSVLHSVNNTLRNKNIEIQDSHKVIEEINRNITKSINYAQRIQQAILPQGQNIVEQLPAFFIIFKPKEVVSGDFYWFNIIDNKQFLIVADCTGHGVPGAFLSMIGSMLLNKIIMEKRQLSPALILEELHVDVRHALQQEDKKRQANDGMDIGLCQLDLTQKTLVYAGAKRPLYVYQHNTQQLIKISGDRKSIGGRQKEQIRHFTNHTIKFSEGDVLYLSSDGFVDQNNAQGKKFGSFQFETMLQSVAEFDPQIQKQKIGDALRKHQGKESQRDDISLIGVKL